MNLEKINPLELDEKESIELFEFLIKQPEDVVENFLIRFIDDIYFIYYEDDEKIKRKIKNQIKEKIKEQDNKPFMKLLPNYGGEGTIINECLSKILNNSK